MRYFIRFSYVGTDYHGSQVQPNGVTVQEVMERSMTTLLRQPVPLTFAGRTDAGVHAREMWAHWDFDSLALPLSQLTARLNNLLPQSIAVQEIVQVVPQAHARYDALSRRYEYLITTCKDPFAYGFAARVAGGLDYEKMNVAARLLLGRHDFASFCKVHTDVKTTFCTVSQSCWVHTGNAAVFTIEADRFLRNMVRAVVGTLFEVGRGKMSKEQFADVLTVRNRCAAGQSAPAEGLYLVKVEYPAEIFVKE
ncbi:MAG: tRNA pseudouridine(38-40) synthase TruA [Paludibacteraceae bacterium]|nr:tRNA pseudouridine(38-40) synthase TruA [Paludibacteraceae bacterium]